MSDIVDRANDRMEIEFDRMLKARRHQSLIPTGGCHYCSEEVREGRLFCDTECRDSYDKETEIRRRQGL